MQRVLPVLVTLIMAMLLSQGDAAPAAFYYPADSLWKANTRLNSDTGVASQGEPAIAADALGNAYTVWVDERNGNKDIYFSYRPAGGSWGTNARVNDDASGEIQFQPSIAVDPSGNAYTAWVDGRNGNWDIYFSYRPKGSNWGHNVRVKDCTGYVCLHPQIDVDEVGNAYVVWEQRIGNNPGDLYFAYRPTGGNWGNIARVNDVPSALRIATPSALAVDRLGNAYAVWTDIRAGLYPNYENIYFSYRPFGGTWSPNTRVDDGNSVYPMWPDIALDSSGNAYAVFEDSRRAPQDEDIYFSYRPAGGTWGTNSLVNTVDTGVRDQIFSTIDVDARGNAYVAWVDTSWGSGPSDVYFAYRLANGTWRSIEKVTDANQAALWSLPDIAVDGSRVAYLVWADARNGNDDIYFSFRPSIVSEARLDIGMLYPKSPFHRDCPSPSNPTYSGDYVGCGGPYHGFYKGVCTDVVLDAYDAGADFNIHSALVQDASANSERYKWRSARNANDMRLYFYSNQQFLPHSQPYEPGDVAFFDWGGDGVTDHVNVVSEVNGNGRPLEVVEAQDVDLPAIEHHWTPREEQHVQGHGRLNGTTVASLMQTTASLQVLRVTIDSPSVALRLFDANGKSKSDTYVESLVASNVEAFIPYIPRSFYSDLGTQKTISVTQPLSNTSQYMVELEGQASATYHLLVETLQDSSVTASQLFTQTISSGDTHSLSITVSAPGGTIQFAATSPTPSPTIGISDSLALSGTTGTLAHMAFTVTEAGGQYPINNATITATDLVDQFGDTISAVRLSITPNNFTTVAGDSQMISIQISLADAVPGEYLGRVIVTSQNAGIRSIPLILDVQPLELYLPLIARN